MYDKWWVVNFADVPIGEHPLYPPVGQQSGTATFRCKECHGWDYKGADGAYGPGSAHFTGIPGVFGSTMTPTEMFDIIKNPNGDGTGGTTVNGHDFGNLGLVDQDVTDIVSFLQDWVIDTDTFIDATDQFLGDPIQGFLNYNNVGDAGHCVNCHGFSGTAINFGTPADPQWIGTIAVQNPWELLHKIRIGTASTGAMPSWLINGDGMDQGAADIGRFAQEHFPVAPPPPGVNAVRGGKLYDRWWATQGVPPPTGEHPLYPPVGQQSGNTTFRCKECHGWDYKGADGAYASGSTHFTGIPGVFGSTMTPQEMFDIIKNPNGDGTSGTTVNGHGFATIGLADADIADLVEFLQTLLLDTNSFIDAGGRFTGDVVSGEALYAGGASCFICHGFDGLNINLGSPVDPLGVGNIADQNAWEFLHKVRIGQPGSTPPMFSWIENGGSDQGAADIGTYAQQLLAGEIGCDGIPDSGMVIDECGLCLDPADPEFNQSCAGCDGVPNSGFIVDECGVCLAPDDPEFNKSCAGCDGIPNSGLIFDECGDCLMPDDAMFNQSCAGCDGLPNSGTVFDSCGICGGDNTSCIVCGNGVRQTGEQCDDGNNIDGDGCSADCRLEGVEIVPTVSTWGLLILAMLLLAAGKVYFGVRPRRA